MLLCKGMMVVLTLRFSLCLLRRCRIGVSVSSALDGVSCLWFMGFLPLPCYFSFFAFDELANWWRLKFLAGSAHDGSECGTVTMARLMHHSKEKNTDNA